MKNALEYIVSWILVGLFYGLVAYSKVAEVVKKTYYDVFSIPYVTGQGKFHPYYVRKDKK